MVLKLLISVLLCSTLVACVSNTSAPQSYYYILDAPSNVQENKVTTLTGDIVQKRIKVVPVRVPDYLHQPNLVLKLSNHQIKIANYHFWAEDLTQSIQRVLINELNVNSAVNYTQQCIDCDALAITIDHFYPNEQGQVLLVGSYELISHTSNSLLTQFSFNIRLQAGGYDEGVAAMRALLSHLATEIKQTPSN